MDMRVTIKEVQVTEYTYEVQDVNSLTQGEQVALKCHRTHFAPRPCYLTRIVPHPANVNIGKVEVS